MSNIKLGLLIFWPTFWTGFPIKLIFALLLLAAHMHPWEGAGLFFLLLISIPVDIWAINLCARTVLIDRLKVDPQPGIGLNLWIRWAIFSAVVLPIITIVLSTVTEAAQSMAAGFAELIKESIYPTLPVAEQITLELVLWGSVSLIVLIVLLLGWLYGLGWLAQPLVSQAKPIHGTADERTYFWDSLRIPSDQPLLLTAFLGTGVLLVFIFWGLMPATTPHPHEEYEYTFEVKEEKLIEPQKVLTETEQVLTKAEIVVQKLQKEKKENPDNPKKNGKGSSEAKKVERAEKDSDPTL